MENLQAVIVIVDFFLVIILLITDFIQMTVLALLGALILVVLNVMTLGEAIGHVANNYSTLALFLGVMIMVRSFGPTKVFDWLARKIMLLSKGKGSRLIIGLVILCSILSAFLPNATVVLLMAPIIPPLAQAIGIDFVPLLLLIVFTANSAGLLTLVGDPVQFIVGEAINMNFVDYLLGVAMSGIVAVATLGLLIPFLFRKTWRMEFSNFAELPEVKINHHKVLIFQLIITAFVLIFFVIGQSLNPPLSPATVALLGATLCMLLSHQNKIDTVPHILKDVDWNTLIFFTSFFAIIGALTSTGIIEQMSDFLAGFLGSNILLSSIMLLFIVGILSSFMPNIPLVAALVPLLTSLATNLGYPATPTGQFPDEVLPLFVALIIGGTLGGNGTVIGAAANLVAVGVAQQYDRVISFQSFLRYGMPIMLLQLAASAIYLLIVNHI